MTTTVNNHEHNISIDAMIMIFVFKKVALLMKDELSFAIMVNGAQYVMTFGAFMMLLLSVDNWDTLIKV